METSQKALGNLNYTLQTVNEDYDPKIYELNNIKTDADNTKGNSTKLETEIRNKENMKYVLEINILVFLSVLTLIGLIGKIFFNYKTFIFI